VAAVATETRRRWPRYAVIAARGSSDNAARYAQHVLGRLCGLPVALATPSLHA
jgi:glutamine---fructose-6-phosphate transaminase (isomerizing)